MKMKPVSTNFLMPVTGIIHQGDPCITTDLMDVTTKILDFVEDAMEEAIEEPGHYRITVTIEHVSDENGQPLKDEDEDALPKDDDAVVVS